MYRSIAILPALLTLTLATFTSASADSLRISHLQRCGNLLDPNTLHYCLDVISSGKTPQVLFNSEALPAPSILQTERGLRLRLDVDQPSGPLWLELDGEQSNPVWLSTRRSHVIAAAEDEVATNQDGLTTWVNLISLIIEEQHDGLQEAKRLAEKYDAEVVGAIPPLNTYQLRLPARNLEQRDALVLRLGNEVSVDAVVIEESSPEEAAERDKPAKPEDAGREWAANRLLDAVVYYQRRLGDGDIPLQPVRIGVIERDVDFDSPDFADYLGNCRRDSQRTCVYARDAESPSGHGSTVTGVLAANREDPGSSGFLRALDDAGPGFDVIVERGSDGGITANVAASVNLVEDGARIINWSWGLHRIGTMDVNGDPVDSLVRSGVAMSGYEELLEEFFLWLRAEHPDVVVVNSAGNGAAHSGRDEYRLPSSFVTDQLFVVGGHQRSKGKTEVENPGYAVRRKTSNVDMRVDITASACVEGASSKRGEPGEAHCGTSYSTPLVAGVIAAMLSINPELEPEQIRMLLRRSAMTIGPEQDFEAPDGDDLTAPILPSERNNQLNDPDVGHSARLDMYRALDLAVKSRDRVR